MHVRLLWAARVAIALLHVPFPLPLQDVPFPDGDPPPDAVIAKWLGICKATFGKANPTKRTIAVHCVAGLGRAPVLVAIALIENGMEPLQAVQVSAAAAAAALRRGLLSPLYLPLLFRPPPLLVLSRQFVRRGEARSTRSSSRTWSTRTSAGAAAGSAALCSGRTPAGTHVTGCGHG